MQGWDWQLTVALVCVAAAVFVLARRAIRLLQNRRAGRCGCGGCGTCLFGESSRWTVKRKPLVPVSSLETPDEESGRSLAIPAVSDQCERSRDQCRP